MKQRTTISKTLLFFFGAICLCPSLSGGPVNAANVDIGVNIALPPLFRIAAPPPVVVVPGTYVYAVPDVDVDIFFFHGAWYRPHQGHWFRASSYNGPWRYVEPRRMPRDVVVLPHYDYRRVPPGHQRIPYGQMKKQWKKWERNRHWERDAAWRGGWDKDENRRDHGWDNGPDRRRGRDWHDSRGPHGRDDRPRGYEPGGHGNGPDRNREGNHGRDR